MSGLEALPGALNEGIAFAPITEDEARAAAAADVLADREYANEAALKLVVQDAVNSEAFLNSKSMVVEWDKVDDLYRAYVRPKTWPNSDIPRSNLGMPIIMEVIDNHLLPSIHMAFFSNEQPFSIEPEGKTSNDAAHAMSKILMWAIKQADFKEEMRLIEKSILQYGYGIGKWGWATETKRESEYAVNGDDVTVTPKEVTVSRPTFEQVNLRRVLVDPGCNRQDCRKGKFIIFQSYTDVAGLDDLREMEGYDNIPSNEDLAVILAAKAEATKNSLSASQTDRFHEIDSEKPHVATTVDPLKQPLELLERWTEDGVITVLQRTIVIRNEKHDLGRMPFNGCAFIDVLDSMFGFGVGKLLSGEQKFQQGVMNSSIDGLALTLNPAFQIQKGLTNARQNISLSPGLVVNEQSELKPLSTNTDMTNLAMTVVESSENRATRRVGANGGSAMPSQALRTAQGVQAFSQDLTTRLQYFIEIFADLVFIPVLEAFVEMCKSKLKPSEINKILTDADGKAFEGSVADIYNGTYSFQVLSSTKLAARKASASVLPLLTQMFSTEAFQDSLTTAGRKVDYDYLLGEALELAGWPVERVLVDMTPEDQQRVQQQNPAAIKAMTDQQKMAQQHAYDLEDIEQQGMAKAGVKVIGHLLKEQEGQ